MFHPISSGKAVFVCLALIAINVAVYAPSCGYGFVNFDDPQYVYGNQIVSSGLTWHGAAWALTTEHDGNWFPLTWLSHMLDVQIYGLNAGGHHLTNLILHIVTTLLLFGLLYRMTGALAQSTFAAALFAVHPLQMESVAWIAERKNVLSTVFWILTVWEYALYVRQPRRGRYFAVLLLYALGLMAKPMLVTLPFTLLLLDVWPLKRPLKFQLLLEKLPMFALTIVSSIITLMVQRQAIIPLDALPFKLRLENAVVSYVTYIGKMLWPVRLGVFYTYPPSIPAPQVAGALLVLLAVSSAVLSGARQRPYLAVGWLWYLGTLTPVIGLVQVGNQAMADRYAYAPLIGLFIIIAWGVPELLGASRLPRTALVGAAVAIAVCALAARNQVQYWRNSIVLWEHTLEVSPGNHFAHNNLGDAYATVGEFDEAMVHYREAVRISPGAAQPHYNLANLLANRGRLDDAISHYTEALRIRPNDPAAHNNLGNVLAKQGRTGEAAVQFSEALQIKPDPLIHYNLAIVLEKQGRRVDAIDHLEAALRLQPNLAPARRALEDLRSSGR